MPGKRRGIPASQLARDYGVSLNDFVSEVTALLDRLDVQPASGRAPARRREICAAVAAAMTAALDASTLTPEERAHLDPLLNNVLLPFWNKHCADDAEAQAYIGTRAAHYLSARDSKSQVKTAVGIVTALIEALEVSQEHKDDMVRKLAPSFAHRMIGDLYRINEVRTKFGIELSLIVTICALLQMSMSHETILRVLRLA
jgi:hypothetical protein